jgi:two-component system, sensor histidine kinase
VSSHQASPNRAELGPHLRDVLEAIPEAILEVDAAGHILLVNVAAEQMFGYSRQEFLTLDVDTLVPTAYRNIHARHRLGYGHQPERRLMGSLLELEAQRRDGFLFPVEISLSPNHSGETLTVIVVVRDITDRKQAETALRASEAKFRTLAHLVPQLVWMCTPDGLNVYFNQRWVDYTGLTLEESYGKGWNTPFHPDDKQRAWDAWNRAVATGEPYRVESRLRAADGSYRWFLMLGLPLQDGSGNIATWFGTCTDIEELKRAEESLHLSEERFRVALKNSPVVVFNQDHELRYTWIISPVLGWAVEDYVGHTDGEIVGGEEGARLTAIKQAVLRSGIGLRTETTVTFQAETHYYDLTVEPLRDAHGVIAGVTCSAVDITPLKQAAVELERLNELKNEFLGMAAHDLRNPIGEILILAEVLGDEVATVLNEEQLRYLSGIRKSSKFMLQLIDELLDVASIEAGLLHLDRRRSDLGKMLKRNVRLNAKLARQKQIQVDLQIEGALPKLSFDEGKIEQVLNNLISNAVKFSQPGTVVEVRAGVHDGSMLISVRDQGPGIPETEREKLFQPFGRTSVRGTASERSTGLGLAIARKIVEGHGGRIWMESQVGVGSVFLFTLPR